MAAINSFNFQALAEALKGSPQPIEGQVALPSDVVNAIGSAVNTAIRGGGALSVTGSGGKLNVLLRLLDEEELRRSGSTTNLGDQ